MRSDLSHLTRYFVVDRYGRPTQMYPAKLMGTAIREANWRNGRQSDGVLGIRDGRPYRVVTLAAVEAPDAD